MNTAHLHLILNHFPLIGLVFSCLLLILGLQKSNEFYVRAGLIILIIAGAFSVPTFLTGEPAEKMMKQLPGFSKNLVEAHEEAAELVIWMIGVTTLSGIAGLWFSIKKSKTPKVVLKAILALLIVSLLLVARVSNLGGKISHPEIRDTDSQKL